jgi:hypothetical protein
MTAKKQEEGRDAGVRSSLAGHSLTVPVTKHAALTYRGLVRDFYSFDRLDTLFGHSIT